MLHYDLLVGLEAPSRDAGTSSYPASSPSNITAFAASSPSDQTCDHTLTGVALQADFVKLRKKYKGQVGTNQVMEKQVKTLQEIGNKQRLELESLQDASFRARQSSPLPVLFLFVPMPTTCL